MKYFIYMVLIILSSCNQNYHITTSSDALISGPLAVISGSNLNSAIGNNNAKVGLIGRFTDGGHVYDDDSSSPANREIEWIFEINNAEVGRLSFEPLATAITTNGANPSATHEELIVDNWNDFLTAIGGSSPTIGDEVCVSALIKNSDGTISQNSSNKVCFMPPLKQVFDYTGSAVVIPVPAGARNLLVKAWGAGGGGYNGPFVGANQIGGAGGYMETRRNTLDASDSYEVNVGEGGSYLTWGAPGIPGITVASGGFPDGGNSLSEIQFNPVGNAAGSGGGSSSVVNTNSGNILAKAGAGGGVADWRDDTSPATNGLNGCTPTSGGEASSNGHNATLKGTGGGGGGFFGGDNNGIISDQQGVSGNGGSCGAGVVDSIFTSYTPNGNFIAPNNSDVDYSTGIAVGGRTVPFMPGVIIKSGGDGRIVLYWIP